MSEQTKLFDTYKISKVENISKLPTDQAFYAFHNANRWIVVELEKIAWEMIRSGHKKIGIQACIEIFRWETRRHTISNDFKMNNNFASRYARMIMDRNPHWGQVFEIRKLKKPHFNKKMDVDSSFEQTTLETAENSQKGQNQ